MFCLILNQPMSDPVNTIDTSGSIQTKLRERVTFFADGLTINKPWGLGSTTFIANEDIAGFRFGACDLRGPRFSFGIQYFIEIKSFKSEIFRVKLNSWFGINRQAYYSLWAELLQKLWDHSIAHQLQYYTELYNIQQAFDLAGVNFYADGISWDNGDRLKWEKIAIKTYQNYFMIYHAEEPTQYKCILFSVRWNAVILQSLLKDIVQEHAKVHRSIRRGL